MLAGPKQGGRPDATVSQVSGLSVSVGKYGGTLRVSEATGFMNHRGGELTTQMLDIYLHSAACDGWLGERKTSDFCVRPQPCSSLRAGMGAR